MNLMLKYFFKRLLVKLGLLNINNFSYTKVDKQKVEIIDYFVNNVGVEIPIENNHRYDLFNAWQMFGPLSAFHELNKRKLLKKTDLNFFNEAKGSRTLVFPVQEIRERLNPYLSGYRDLFIASRIPDLGSLVLRPTQKDTEKKISRKLLNHKIMINNIKLQLPFFKFDQAKVLEIGYTSGGESIIAFERAGLIAKGLDNNYDGNFQTNKRHEEVKKIANSNVEFLVGDITKKTPIRENSLDFIYSLSVIEHIKDIKLGFEEMYRILKPGGIMYHCYDPYFHIKGGHLPGVLDSPWAHMRMHDSDVIKYIKKHRPYEANITIPWIKASLNRGHSEQFVQKSLIDSGFNLISWKVEELPKTHLLSLNGDILKECFAINKNISLSDLKNYAVKFLAIK